MSRRSQNVHLARLCARAGTNDPHAAIASILRPFRSEGESLRQIAHKCGVDGVVEEPLPFDGGIFQQSGGRLVIKLNSHGHHSRRQFTLAHEVGHLVIGSVVGPKARLSCRKSPNLERVCDMIAAELLMPAARVKAAVEEMKCSSPGNLRKLADMFGVSMQAAAVRVHCDLRLWTRRIGLWQWGPTLSEIWFVGRRPWDTRSPNFAAFESARSSAEPVRSVDETRCGEWVRPVSLELLNVGFDRILGLVGVVS